MEKFYVIDYDNGAMRCGEFKNYTECYLCPLKSPTSNIRCGLRDIPANWKIKDYNEYNAFQR